MATVNFSVPEDNKNAFNSTFKGVNKSAVIADLMREAVERAQSQQRIKDAYERILQRRQHVPQRIAFICRETKTAETKSASCGI